MDPLTLLALAAAAGFIFGGGSSQAKKNNEEGGRELTYSRDIVARAKGQAAADFDVSSINVLPEYELVRELVKKEFPLIFVTGGAGTGKSTFIRWLLSQYKGKVMLGAPTAMAAINIEGKTLHSLCNLPPAWIVKNDIKHTPRRLEIKEAKLLIIDEISMVTANLLDGVSAYLRLNRGIDKPFGGLSVVMVGDMFQLPPVVAESTRDLFERIYGSAKFYNARCLRETPYYAFELTRTFRQAEQGFVNLLTRLREGIDLQEVLGEFNTRCKICPEPPESAVWLSPRNAEVDARNAEELGKISAQPRMYHGTLGGTFKTSRLPSPKELVLKPGAQVMFTKNDQQRQWTNGTIGRVRQLNADCIAVELAETGKLVDVKQVKWADYRYTWNDSTNEIERHEIGNYKQFPLILGWAITIHKSQGRTIDKVHLDLGAGAFETGQTYVALSRCRSMEGLTLSRPLNFSDVLVDEESKVYYENLRQVIRRFPPGKMAEYLGIDVSHIKVGCV